MATARAGGQKNALLADPALTNQRLDAIRLWLRSLRDGHAEQQGDRGVIRNQRSHRDPPARREELRAEGGWRRADRSGCRIGQALPGGEQCEIRLPPGTRGALVFKFAASPGLDPQPVRLELALSR